MGSNTEELGWRVAWAAIAVVAIAGCTERWTVVKAGPEGTFVGTKSFEFDALSLDGAKIDGARESDFLEGGDEVFAEQWTRGRAVLLERYPHALKARLAERGITLGAGPTIGARIDDLTVAEMYTVDDNPNNYRTRAKLIITLSSGGAVVDEIRVEEGAVGFATKPVEQRFGELADTLGTVTADFVSSRTND